MSEIKTPEQLLKAKIDEHNSRSSDFFKFAFTPSETKMFCELIESYHSQFKEGIKEVSGLPSDDEIYEWAKEQSKTEPTGAEEFGRVYGAKWMLKHALSLSKEQGIEAVEFGDWLAANDWKKNYRVDKKEYQWQQFCLHSNPKRDYKTTAELYKLFKEEKGL